MINTPDFDLAATRALEILRDNHITETPINPLPILLETPGVRVMPFTKMANEVNRERHDLIPMFGTNTDAATFHLQMPGLENVEYVVVYNMRLPFEIIWRGIARELGHIVLGHTGMTRTADARMAEALCFAHHLISPRPIIHFLQRSGLPLTMNVLSAVTGCSDECVDELQTIPGVQVPADLNAQIRELFAPHLTEYINFAKSSAKVDRSPVVDFGSFMDGYEE